MARQRGRPTATHVGLFTLYVQGSKKGRHGMHRAGPGAVALVATSDRYVAAGAHFPPSVTFQHTERIWVVPEHPERIGT